MTDSTVSSDGLTLTVRTLGDNTAPTVVLVHGFPDTQAVWEPVAEQLVRDGLRVVAYDVRGAGGSDAPATRAGYQVERLVDDLVAVLDATAPGQRVHLAGHDWGSVQLWSAVAGERDDPRLRDRIASYSSINGPALEHFGEFLRIAATRRDLRALANQLCRSWYIAAFCVPVLPEWVFGSQGGRIRQSLQRSQGLGRSAHWGDSFARDAANGVNLYRANVVRGTRHGHHARTRVPVQLIVSRHDRFLTPVLYDEVPRFVDDLTRVDIDAGHWAPRTHPDLVAETIGAFVRDHLGPDG